MRQIPEALKNAPARIVGGILATPSTMREILNDRATRLAATILILIIALTSFNLATDVTTDHPLLGLFLYGLVPLLFVAGGIVFVWAMWRNY